MRAAPLFAGVAMLLSGLALLTWLLYDATALVEALGFEAAGGEAPVVLVGLAIAALALGAGVWRLRRSFRERSAAC